MNSTGTQRNYERVIIGALVLVVFGVPGSQIVVELFRGTPVRCTDLLRSTPTTVHLRDFEHSLEEQWWGNRVVRPYTARALYDTLGRTNRKVLTGRDGWLFYRAGVDYLLEKRPPLTDRTATNTTTRLQPNASLPVALQAIVRFDHQLRDRGLNLLVVPVPGKACIYPDRLTRRAAKHWSETGSPTESLLDALRERGVKTVDLFAVLRAQRQALQRAGSHETLYLRRDTHWSPAGAAVAATAVARQLVQLGLRVEHKYAYTERSRQVRRYGDLTFMLGLPATGNLWPAESVPCRQIIDPFLERPLLPKRNERPGIVMNQHLVDTPMEARILLLGDSYSRIYQLPEPASLGSHQPPADDRTDAAAPEVRKRLLPGGGGLPALLAQQLGTPVDFIVSDGGAATRVRQMLSVTPEILQHKQWVIWEFAERDLQLGSDGWREVALPPDERADVGD